MNFLLGCICIYSFSKLWKYFQYVILNTDKYTNNEVFKKKRLFENNTNSQEYKKNKIYYINTIVSCFHSFICGFILPYFIYNYQNSIYLDFFCIFSSSYFLYDTYECLNINEYMYVLHHIISFIPLLLSVNDYNLLEPVLTVTFLSENTAFFHNLGYILKKNNIYYYKHVWLFNVVNFIVLRLVFIPIVFFYESQKYTYEDVLPFYISFTALIAGNIHWAKGQIRSGKKLVREIIYKKID